MSRLSTFSPSQPATLLPSFRRIVELGGEVLGPNTGVLGFGNFIGCAGISGRRNRRGVIENWPARCFTSPGGRVGTWLNTGLWKKGSDEFRGDDRRVTSSAGSVPSIPIPATSDDD